MATDKVENIFIDAMLEEHTKAVFRTMFDHHLWQGPTWFNNVISNGISAQEHLRKRMQINQPPIQLDEDAMEVLFERRLKCILDLLGYKPILEKKDENNS